MPVTQIGLVYYTDDPHRRVFRTVYPEFDDRELDEPPTDGVRAVMRDSNGNPHTWTSFGVNSARPVAMDKVQFGVSHGRKRGTPWTPATEPVVYFINYQVAYQLLTDAQKAQLDSWLAANPQWSNFIDLGSGDPATLATAANIISPSWIAVIDGNPGIGTLQRSFSFSGHTATLWAL